MYNQDGKKRGHAIALFSGGLDSALAILLMLQQNIEVTAITFMTHFGCDLGDRSSCGSDPYPAAEKWGFNVKLMHLGQKFVDIVTNPQFGRGKNMNPCTDCRLLMLTEAKAFMEMVNADFIITGEVMGQRPMSQVKDKMSLVLRKSGLEGRLVRPLSAKLLEPTIPEIEGMLDREKLEGISGRSRKRQMELAKEFGLDDYPNPGSGCLLTDEGYSNRLRDLLAHTEHVTFDDLNMLRIGRHFRLNRNSKAIIGRDEDENKKVEGIRKIDQVRLEAPDIGSPVTILIGEVSDEAIEKAARITARYSAGRDEATVRIEVASQDSVRYIEVAPATEDEIKETAVR